MIEDASPVVPWLLVVSTLLISETLTVKVVTGVEHYRLI